MSPAGGFGGGFPRRSSNLRALAPGLLVVVIPTFATFQTSSALRRWHISLACRAAGAAAVLGGGAVGSVPARTSIELTGAMDTNGGRVHSTRGESGELPTLTRPRRDGSKRPGSLCQNPGPRSKRAERVKCPRETPARKWRTVGRIEHTLLDGGRASTPTDLRPSPATPLYHRKLQMFQCAAN